MIVCVAIDDNLGMMFNNRRQSQDKILREHMINMCSGSKLWMNEYSGSQFEMPLSEQVIVDEDFLEKAGSDDYCFVENMPLAAYEERIQRFIVFKWNRIYPADTYFDIPLSEHGWELINVTEFEGNSHKNITKEEWSNVKRYHSEEMD